MTRYGKIGSHLFHEELKRRGIDREEFEALSEAGLVEPPIERRGGGWKGGVDRLRSRVHLEAATIAHRSLEADKAAQRRVSYGRAALALIAAGYWVRLSRLRRLLLDELDALEKSEAMWHKHLESRSRREARKRRRRSLKRQLPDAEADALDLLSDAAGALHGIPPVSEVFRTLNRGTALTGLREAVEHASEEELRWAVEEVREMLGSPKGAAIWADQERELGLLTASDGSPQHEARAYMQSLMKAAITVSPDPEALSIPLYQQLGQMILKMAPTMLVMLGNARLLSGARDNRDRAPSEPDSFLAAFERVKPLLTDEPGPARPLDG